MILDIVIIVLLIGIWLTLRELPMILGSTVSSGIIRSRYIPVIIIVSMFPAILFNSDIAANINTASNLGNPVTLLIISFAAAISVWIVSFFTKWTSIIYGLLAAILALNLYTQGSSSHVFFWKSSLVWLISPGLSFIFSILLFRAVRQIVTRANLHLVTLNGILRVVFIFSLIIVLFSFALNNGSLIMALTSALNPLLSVSIAGNSIHGVFIAWFLFIILVLILYLFPVRKIASKISFRLFDINTESGIVIMTSMSLVLLFFSSNKMSLLIGLQATPVSIVHIALGAVIGIGWIQKSVAVDKKELIKSALSVVVLPGLSFILTYSILAIIDIQKGVSKSNRGFTGGELNFDLTTLTSVIVLAILSFFVVYFYISKNRASGQARLKIAEDRNQLNEMQKAMVDLEIKVIQSENNNLHKRLEIKRKDLINNALWIGQQRDFLDQLSADIHLLKKSENLEEMKSRILSIESKIMDKKAFSHEMNELYSQVEILHKDYSVILQEKFPDLTEQERRLATLLRLGFSTKELASIMSITPKSVEVCRYRLRKRLNLKRDDNLIQFIKSL